MRPLTVIAQAFAVIARDDDERAIEDACGPQRGEQPRELRVRIRDLAVVRTLRTRREFRWRRVRRMWIV